MGKFSIKSVISILFQFNTKLAQKVLSERGNFGLLADFTEFAKPYISKLFYAKS